MQRRVWNFSFLTIIPTLSADSAKTKVVAESFLDGAIFELTD